MNILVTGASRGIGKAIAESLIKAGHKVFVSARNEERLKSYENYTPARPSELPSYYLFGGWYKDKACTTKFDFNTEKNAKCELTDLRKMDS